MGCICFFVFFYDISSFSSVAQMLRYNTFLFSMYLNDLENELIQKGAVGFDIGMLKLQSTSLSRTRLFRITAYLEVKIRSCFTMKL